MTIKPKASPRTRLTIEAEIAAHEQKRAEAGVELDRLGKLRPAMLLDLSDGADDRMDDLDRQIRHAERVAPRVAAALATLRTELAAVLEAEEEARCEEEYAKGIAARDEYKRLSSKYNKAAADVAAILCKMNDQKDIIANANFNLPRRAIREHHPKLCAADGIYSVADRVNLPGMLGEPAAWTAATEPVSVYQQDRILVR